MARPRGTDGARVITAIETRSCRGLGTTQDPCRVVIQYWDFDGNFLAEKDEWKGREDEEKKNNKELIEGFNKYLNEGGQA